MKKIKILLLLVFLSLTAFLLVACKSHVMLEFDRYIEVYNEGKKINSKDKVLTGSNILVKPNLDELRKEKKTFDYILLNDEKKTLDNNKEYKFKIKKNATIKSGDKRDVNSYNLVYDKTYFNISPESTSGRYFEDEKITLTLKEQYPKLGMVAYFEVNGERKNMVSSYQFIMKKDTQINYFSENVKTIKREKEIDAKFITTPSQIEGRGVKKRTIIEKFLLPGVISYNLDKSYFVFNRPGRFQIQYEVEYEDSKKESLVYEYSIKPSQKDRYTFDDNLRLKDIKGKFLKYENMNESDIRENLIKEVGLSNNYIPDIKADVHHFVFDKDKNDFVENVSTYDIYELGVPFDINYRLLKKEGTNFIEINQSEYFEKVGSQIKFNKNIASDDIYKLEIKHKDFTSYEYIKLKDGFNAYKDTELREYFLDVKNVENVFLQRNLKPTEHPDQVTTITDKDGNSIKSGLNTGIDGIKFDSNYDLIKSTMFKTGSIYTRVFTEKNIEQKPIKFNGNYYTVDATNFTHVKEINEQVYKTPEVNNGIFNLVGGFALKDNEIKNVFIKGNGGIHGSLIGGENGVPLYSGALIGVHINNNPLKSDNITVIDCSDGATSRRTRLTLNNSKFDNNYSLNIKFANTEGEKNVITGKKRSFEILEINNSKILNAGSAGIGLFDANRRSRHDDLATFPENKGLDLASYQDINDDREIFSVDPSLYINNTIIECLIDPNGQIFKTFGIAQYQKQVEKANEDYLKKLFKKSILHKRDKKQLFNVAMLLENYFIIAEPVNDKEKEGYYLFHDVPSWDIKIDGKTNYNPSNYYDKSPTVKGLNADLPVVILPTQFPNWLEKLERKYMLNLKTESEKYGNNINNIPNEEKKRIATETYATSFLQALKSQNTDYRDRFIQLYYTGEFIYSPTNKGRLNASVVVGYVDV